MKSKRTFTKLFDKQIVGKFLVVGSVAFVLNYLMLEVFIATFWQDKVIAEIAAMIVSVNLTFLLHDRWTYLKKDVAYLARLERRYASYILTNSSGSIITIILFAIFSHNLPNLIALALAALIAMCWNFCMNLIIWKQRNLLT